MTNTGATSFTQSGTATVATTCPAGIYGSPATSTTNNNNWSPTPAAACPIAKLPNSLPINGQSYLALCAATGSGGTWSCAAQVYIEFDPSGTYEVVREVNTKTTTVASGTWLPSGDSASNYVISVGTSVVTNSNGTNGSVNFSNAIGSGPVSMSTTRTVGISTTFLYRGPSLPDNVNGGSGSESISITIKKSSTGATETTTIKLTAQAQAGG